jgi:group I intron endonuclease
VGHIMDDSFYKLGGIYSITHTLSGRVYVGSALLFFKRWSEHRIKLNKNTHSNKRLQNFWNKYGEEAFEFKIVEIIKNPTKELLEQREQYWIDYYNSANRKIGFNIRKIAQNNMGLKHSEETKQKMRVAHLGISQTDEHKKNNVKARRESKIWRKALILGGLKHRGKKWTPEQREHQSNAQKLRWKKQRTKGK